MKLKLTILAAALSLATTAFAGETQQTFNATDMQQLFGQKSGATQLATLSQKEMKETEGGIWVAVSRTQAYPGGPVYITYYDYVFKPGVGYVQSGAAKVEPVTPLASQPVQKVPVVAVLGSGLGYVAPAGTPAVLGSGLGYAAPGTAVLR